MGRGLRDLIEEANRRRVFRKTGVYVVAVWGLSQGAVQVAPALGLPPGILRFILVGAVVLLALVVALAWSFDVSREGIVGDPGDQPTLGVGDADTLATMPTALGVDQGFGAVVVRWADGAAQSAAMFREASFIGRGAECGVRFRALRVNEAAPLLRLERIAAGPAVHEATSRYGDVPAVAHVRVPARNLAPPARPAPTRS